MPARDFERLVEVNACGHAKNIERPWTQSARPNNSLKFSHGRIPQPADWPPRRFRVRPRLGSADVAVLYHSCGKGVERKSPN